MKSRDLVLKRSCFQIGNGASIHIQDDPWIPSMPNFKPVPYSIDFSCDFGLVFSLIDDEGYWKTE